ncbi:MAG: hypothetical protein FIA98_13820 [Anaerolineae bacterium]|nr:hypothetical protein [Anaerolineae bacterium]
MKLSCVALVFICFATACEPLQTPAATPASSSTLIIPPTREPTSTILPTQTLVFLPEPTSTATPQPQEIPFFQRVTSLTDHPLNPYMDLQVRALAEGSLWIITNQSVLRWYDQKWEEILSESKDFLAAVDDSGRLWVLRQDMSKIDAWQAGKWMTYGAESGWTDPVSSPTNWWAPIPWSLYNDAEGTLWAPMARDVRAFDGNRWTVYSLTDMGFAQPDMEDISIVHSLATAKAGAEVWVGECYYSGPGPMGGGGVRWFDGKIWQAGNIPDGATCVSTLQEDLAENVWLGSYGSIWRCEHTTQSWTEYRLPKELLFDYNFAYPQQLIIDRVGDVWVIMQMCGGASCSGLSNLYRVHNGEWSLVIDAQSWSSQKMQLALDSGGQGWLFGDGNVFQLEGGSAIPVASIETRGIGVDPDGRVWVIAQIGNDLALLFLNPQGEE